MDRFLIHALSSEQWQPYTTTPVSEEFQLQQLLMTTKDNTEVQLKHEAHLWKLTDN
jgi:hypothetical protein